MISKLAGEFRCVVKNADGTTKIDTGFQDNLILNNGLDFFGGGVGIDMAAYCLVGSGNSTPLVTQNALDNFLAVNSSTLSSSFTDDYDLARDGNLYKNSSTYTYQFTNLNNVNISEIGLSSSFDGTYYYLCTRALIKDSAGQPMTITINTGETLNVQYKIWRVFSLVDETGLINMIDGDGVETPYNYKVRMAGVGGITYGGSDRYGSTVGKVFRAGSGNSGHQTNTGAIGEITEFEGKGAFLYYSGSSVSLPLKPYIKGSFKREFTWEIGLTDSNGINKSITILTTMGNFHIEYSRVSDSAGILKNDKQKLTLPFEISWGRYEGAL